MCVSMTLLSDVVRVHDDWTMLHNGLPNGLATDEHKATAVIAGFDSQPILLARVGQDQGVVCCALYSRL